MNSNGKKIFKKRIAAVLVTLLFSLALTSCSSAGKSDETTISETTISETVSSAVSESVTEAVDEVTAIDKDREGNSIVLPETINRIISFGPSNTEILIELGFGDKIIAADTYSSNVSGIDSNMTLFDMMAPDSEALISLTPDVVFVTGMSKASDEDPYKAVSDTGICVIYIPTSSSIDGIKEDIRYISAVMNVVDKGEAIVAGMESEIDAIKAIGSTVSEKKKVYFEVSAAPYMYSFGNGVFLDEMLEIIGAENALGSLESWVSVSDENVLDSNPDVILTNVNYIDEPIKEIKERAGWENIEAVKNDAVYYIDTDSSSRPSHNIIKALHQMAESIYPDLY